MILYTKYLACRYVRRNKFPKHLQISNYKQMHVCACMLWGVVEIDIIYYDEEDRDFNSLFIALITSENIKL